MSTAVCFAPESAELGGNGKSGFGKEKSRKKQKCPVVRLTVSVPQTRGDSSREAAVFCIN